MREVAGAPVARRRSPSAVRCTAPGHGRLWSRRTFSNWKGAWSNSLWLPSLSTGIVERVHFLELGHSAPCRASYRRTSARITRVLRCLRQPAPGTTMARDCVRGRPSHCRRRQHVRGARCRKDSTLSRGTQRRSLLQLRQSFFVGSSATSWGVTSADSRVSIAGWQRQPGAGMAQRPDRRPAPAAVLSSLPSRP